MVPIAVIKFKIKLLEKMNLEGLAMYYERKNKLENV